MVTDDASKRDAMVDRQIAARGVRDPRVIAAMRAVPRHEFVPEDLRHLAYADRPLPIGYGQTISQPYIVAFMTSLLDVHEGARVLEIGTGSGYQAAVLCELGATVFSVEVVPALAEQAEETLRELGYTLTVQHGDGYRGWPEEAPFDRIILTAAPPELPEALVDQLAVGGTMVLPVGTALQHLDIVRRDERGRLTIEHGLPVQFVPMVHDE